MKPRIAISIGDPNGVGVEIALRAHEAVSERCTPVYCADRHLLENAAALLGLTLPENLELAPLNLTCTIEPGVVSAKSGRYAYESFMKAVALSESGNCDAITTMPIHKEAWMKAGLRYKGHTDLLRRHFGKEAIMMLGCEQMYVALYTEHMPLKEVPSAIEDERLTAFLVDLQRSLQAEKIGVLGLNPHAGDNGVLGNEERIIERAIANANKVCGGVFEGPLVPDIAFTPASREQFTYFCAMYHDQGLAPLKALYFDESINVSLNLPVIRTSVDHGTAFDIAYKGVAKVQSYHNAISYALTLIERS